MAIERPDWNGGLPAVTPSGSSAPAVREFSRDDLALVNGLASSNESTSHARPLTLAAIDAELETINELRKTNSRKYWSDPVQARQLELIEAQIDAKEAARQERQIKVTAENALRGVPDRDAFEAGFDTMFAGLPEPAQNAIRHELGSPLPDPARGASEADLKRFASTPEGAELIAEWGTRHAGKRLAILRERIDRLTSFGGGAASEWFDNLPAAQAKAVMKALAGG